MAWSPGSGSAPTSQTLNTITTTEQFFTAAQLNPGELIDLQVSCPTHGTDACIVSVYATKENDDTAWDTEPIAGAVLPALAATNRVSIPISGYYRVRVGVKMAGSTNTPNVTLRSRRDGVSL